MVISAVPWPMNTTMRAIHSALRHQESAVDLNHLAVNEAGLIAAEKHNHIGNLLGCPQPANRCRGTHSVEALRRGERAMVIRVHCAWRNRIHANIQRSELFRQALRHGRNCAFSSRIGKCAHAPPNRAATDDTFTINPRLRSAIPFSTA